MSARTATIVIGVVDAAVWALCAVAAITSTSDHATIGLDQAAGWAVTILFLVTGAPGLALGLMRRARRTALALVLAFPAAFVVLFAAAVVVFM